MKVLPPIELSMVLARKGSDIFFQRQKISTPDCIIPRLGTKKASYTLAVIRQFEMLSVTSLNPSQAMGRTRDKLRSLQILARNNVGIPRTFFLDALSDIDVALDAVGGAPVIIKVPEGTQGMGVMLAESIRSARSILESQLNQGQHVFVQEFIEESQGKDIRIIILGGRMIAAMQRSSLGDEFRSNVHRGGTQSSIKISIEAQKTAQVAARLLGLQFAGVDVIESNRGPLVLEVNSSPGLEGIENATGLNIARQCTLYLEKLRNTREPKDRVGY